MIGFNIDAYNLILHKLSNEQFYLYGAGENGKRFYKKIENTEIEKNFLGFVISKNRTGEAQIEEIAEIDDKRTLIVITAHSENSKQMEENLKKLGFNNYINTYPFMTELLYGCPYETDKMIDIDSFLFDCHYGNYLAICYLAVDCLMGHNDYGMGIYQKVLGLYSNEETIRIRCEALKKRVENYDKFREGEEYNIKVNIKERFILDGSHRVVLAKYFGIKKCCADLYSIKLEDYRRNVLDNKLFLDSELNEYFSSIDCERIINVRKRILNQRI